ncbi:MAG: Fe-S cluster assembly protein SufB [Absicoccus porci]|jgi:Fe-S cluster assembly protein SufB|uniref:Fe-S cluster assembly protein SufB n=1 Tax=Absicoccus porci TaxID=2486576 RepID=A0A3N0I461_9FIRM|nr:Fe-S cluster assembly protein SufB [Absicoccus porci]MCI6088358.1 Fe-S cluster assembly protein SufB [Absicoccus porci]MDD6460481.1 Fe-S cluster assembly protein SufB [Absicoccus porci]MDD7329430.1 Fe-S cluster assembly protein SufB [Absicoccus porci]MDY4738999.1 Fe-S cluster assembly protein SufB [Absicoccus porci]MEE1354933.1 Fe-S cluster assembly protein SufB [Absicoccus porci]
MADEKEIKLSTDYEYGFHDKDVSVFNTGKGLNEEVVRTISKAKKEPEWMLDIRLKAYHSFVEQKNPDWGPDLSHINFDDYIYYIKPSEKEEHNWDEVPETIRNTFNKLGIPEAEQKYLAGVSTQYESEVVYHNMLEEVQENGVIFLDTDTAVKTCPDLVKDYFGKVVPYTDNKYAALNTAVWSGGVFIYVPPGVHLEKPLQSYFRINTMQMGQFERTLIIVDEGADINYVEGCTAPVYSKDSLHAAVVEIFVKKNAHCRYSTVQNWSSNILNLVTQRAIVSENGHMEWVDGNIGSHINMKYPCTILAEPYAKGTAISIAVGSQGQKQDTGSKMIHLAPHTKGTMISKSVARNGGEVNFRGWVRMNKNADHSKCKVECDTLILDEKSRSDTVPLNILQNETSQIEHEATVSNVDEEQLFYLMSRGLTEEQATEMIVMGFLEPFTRELPMEYAVELNQLLKLDMSNSIG